MAQLDVKNLMQQYLYGTTGVNDLSFSVTDSFVILGAEESGKTSLLEVLAGKRTPFRGDVLLDSVSVKDIKNSDKSIIFVRERDGIFMLRSVFFNLAYPLKLRKLPKEEIEKSVLLAAEAVGLSNLLRRIAGRLTKYQKAALKLARCFVRNANFIFVDCVQKSLGVEERSRLLQEIYPKIQALGGVKVFATDSYSEAVALSENGAVLYYGITEQIGKVSDFYTHPETISVFSLTHGELSVEEGILFVDKGEIILDNRKILLRKDGIKHSANGDVLVATATNGDTHIYLAESEKLVYFD